MSRLQCTSNVSITVSNPNFPNVGKVAVSGSCNGKVSDGAMVVAVQAVGEVDDYGADLTIKIVGVITKSGTATVTNEGYKQIELGDPMPDALQVEVSEWDGVTAFGGDGTGQLNEIETD